MLDFVRIIAVFLFHALVEEWEMAATLKSARMELKTTEEAKELLSLAAALDGMDLTAFVLDSVGGGEAFSATCLLGRARGWPLEQTLARANEFAGAICAVSGAVPRDMGFYDKWVARWRAS
jgi:hypothetical protein